MNPAIAPYLPRPNRNAPVKLNPRHYTIALMMATGKRDAEIAAYVGLSTGRLKHIRASPLFQALVQQTIAEVRRSTLARVAERIADEADATLDVVVKFRDMGYAPVLPDGTAVLTPDDKRLGFAAAKELLARQVPVETKHTEERRVTKIVIGGEELRALMTAMHEDGGVPTVIDVTAVATPSCAAAPTLDEAIAALRAAEAAPDTDDDGA